MNTSQLVQLMAEFTRVYQQSKDKYTREAECMKVQWRGIVLPIQQGDLFAGRSTQTPIGCRPQSDEESMGYYIHHNAINALYNSGELSGKDRNTLDGLVKFWDLESTVAKAKTAFTAEMQQALPSGNYVGESGIAFTLWRMGGIQLD